MREAVANAIEHGNGGDPARSITVDLTIGVDELCVAVHDEGAGFDPASVPDPRSPERRLRPRGRGLLLMSRALDSVACTPHPAGGSVVTLRRRLPRAAL